MSVPIELPLVLAFFAFVLTGSVYTNLTIYRTCYTILNYNKTECSQLGFITNNITQKLEKAVEPEAATINMVNSTVENCISLLFCLFIGPWSDKFGRKPVMIASLTASIVSTTGLIVFSLFESLSPWYLLFCTIPGILTGGSAAFMTVLLSYMTDITTEQNRGVRLGIMDATLSVGMLAGTMSSSYILSATNYAWVFTISTVCVLCALLCVVFLIPESLRDVEIEARTRGFFSVTKVVAMVKSSIKKRENYDRAVLMCCVLTMVLSNFAGSEESVKFLFLREKFQWSLKKFTLFGSASSVVGIFGTVVGVYGLHKLLKIPESVLMLVGFISLIGGALMLGLATKDIHIYMGLFFRIPGSGIGPMTRSLISKIVQADEVGSIFSVSVVITSFVSLFGSPLYTAIYKKTLNRDPAFYNFVSVGINVVNVVAVLVIIYIRTLKRGVMRYFPFDNSSERETED